MKKKKGFTLVELLGIIVILAVIILLIVPIVDTNLQKNKEELYTTQIENISLALKNWGAENMFNLPNDEGGAITVTLGQLKQAGFIDEDVVNPITGECFPNDMLLTITKKGNNYEYEVLTDSGSAECNEEVNLNAPIIGLKGRTVVYVEINTPYVEPGLIITKADGTPLSMDRVEKIISGPKDYIDTSILGTYQITYKITDAGSTSSIVRTVIVQDTIPPVITVEKVTNIASIGSAFDVMQGVTATDNSGLKPTLSSEGTVNTSISGTYEIKYTAIDTSGNKATETRKIIVSDTTAPEVAVSIVGNPFNSNGWANGKVEVKIESSDASSGIDKIYTCVSKNGKCTPTTVSRNSTLRVDVNEEGTNTYVCAYAVDVTGNKSNTVCSPVIKIDKTAPKCNLGSLKGTLGQDGWYRSAVEITGTCDDGSGSGCVSPSVTSKYGSNTTSAGDNLSPGTVSDKAGNSTTCGKSATFKIDMTAPTCTTVVHGSPNSRGWYQVKSVLIEGQCSDSGSGCITNPTETVKETRGGDFTPGTVSDKAGNTASCPTHYLQVDGTPPTHGGTITVKNDWGGHDVRHHTMLYDNISYFNEMVYEYWWCYGGSGYCGNVNSHHNYYKQYAGYTFGYVGNYGDNRHVINSSNGYSGTVWFRWGASDAAGNYTLTCHYYSRWNNYQSGGYSGC